MALACGQAEPPPGRLVGAEAAPSLAVPAPEASAERPGQSDDVDEPGHGAKLASIAMRTWVYQRPFEGATKLGYLRAGAVVDRAERSAGVEDCDGGWYRVAPRGFVCVGKGASLELDHPVVKAALRGPVRDRDHAPYTYVISREPPPHRYFKLASREEQEEAEGDGKRRHSIALFEPQLERLGEADPIPAILGDGKPLPKPYGAERPLSLGAHRGRANDNSAFGLMATFDWTGRRLGLTTELDLIPPDRTRLAPESSMRGTAYDKEGTPAVVASYGVKTYERNSLGKLVATGSLEPRRGVLLTGQTQGGDKGFVETAESVWLPAGALRIARVRDDPAGFAERGQKWIDISIRRQLLVAYEGRRPVFATLVSTGRGGMGDPKKTQATIRGAFMIHAKHVSGTMDGDDTREDSFDLRDVPFIQYFHQGFALHGAYWHDEFGKERSHGCVNLSPHDAAWLFEWTEPQVPEGWHGALNLNAGTLVWIHG